MMRGSSILLWYVGTLFLAVAFIMLLYHRDCGAVLHPATALGCWQRWVGW